MALADAVAAQEMGGLVRHLQRRVGKHEQKPAHRQAHRGLGRKAVQPAGRRQHGGVQHRAHGAHRRGQRRPGHAPGVQIVEHAPVVHQQPAQQPDPSQARQFQRDTVIFFPECQGVPLHTATSSLCAGPGPAVCRASPLYTRKARRQRAQRAERSGNGTHPACRRSAVKEYIFRSCTRPGGPAGRRWSRPSPARRCTGAPSRSWPAAGTHRPADG